MLVPRRGSGVVAYHSQFDVGCSGEDDAQRGMAHFLEHMMFRGTKKALKDGDFDRVVAEMGGVDLNAYTSYDSTAYHVSIPSGALAALVQMEAERLVFLDVGAAALEAERGAVLGELRIQEDVPVEKHWQLLMRKAFAKHPYRHPIIGYAAQLEAFSAADFERFYTRHYVPNRLTVILVGDLDVEATCALLDRHYGSLPRGEEAPSRAALNPERDFPWGESFEALHPEVSHLTLSLAWPSLGVRHPDSAALLLLSAYLGLGRSSPLEQCLVRDGLASHFSCTRIDEELGLVDAGLFLVDVSLLPGQKEVTDAVQAIEKELIKIQAGQIAARGLLRAKRQLLLNHYLEAETHMGLAAQLGNYHALCQAPDQGERLLEALKALTAEQVAAFACRYLDGRAPLSVVQRPSRAA